MLLPPTVNLFRDDCLSELDLHRFRGFLFENAPVGVSSNAPTNVLMDVVMPSDGNEQDLEPFDPAMLKPLQSLPPGKLPGINFEIATGEDKIPSSIFSSNAALSLSNASTGNSPKRRKIDPSQQNITIQHF
jgi:hypothetical protein